jgi:propanol-preferring alcohol dehydrogenase
MKAVVFKGVGAGLEPVEMEVPRPSTNQLLLKVRACGVCRTDLHIIDGDLVPKKLPLVPGHQIVGVVEKRGKGVKGFARGEWVGVPWLGWTCGRCRYCRSGRENLCERAKFTGYDLQGGFAEYAVVDHRYCFKLPKGYRDEEAAPLLCAGLIGYRAYRMVGEARRLGFYGFGSAAHLLIQVARFQGKEVFAFTREGDVDKQEFARSLGAVWAGGSDERPPEKLEAAIIFAPVGELVPRALSDVVPGGTVVCAGIRMSDIPRFPYEFLWGEKTLRSVANLTRKDGEEFFKLASRAGVRAEVAAYPLEEINRALADLRSGKVKGSAVVVVSRD